MNSLSNKSIKCKICSSSAVCRSDSVPGYQEGETYEIYECPSCRASFAEPYRDSASLYNIIYANSEAVPGYSRYFKYSRDVLKAVDPLAYLASREECYWAVAASLKSDVLNKNLKLYEIGSGLGYLTYSLRKSGFSVTGFDLSSVAVRNASAKYGPYFEQADLSQLCRLCPQSADVVILTEVIEHIFDPVSFLRDAVALIRPGGRLILTTPNKSVYPDDTIWESELPPIHWWWFTEESIKIMANQLGCHASFVDFSDFNRQKQRYISMSNARSSVLNSGGNLKSPVKPGMDLIRSATEMLGRYRFVRWLRRKRSRMPLLRTSGLTLCAILRKNG